MWKRRLRYTHREHMLNIPKQLVESMHAKEGDIFEIYAGEGGVFVVGRSPENNEESQIPEKAGDPDNDST